MWAAVADIKKIYTKLFLNLPAMEPEKAVLVFMDLEKALKRQLDLFQHHLEKFEKNKDYKNIRAMLILSEGFLEKLAEIVKYIRSYGDIPQTLIDEQKTVVKEQILPVAQQIEAALEKAENEARLIEEPAPMMDDEPKGFLQKLSSFFKK